MLVAALLAEGLVAFCALAFEVTAARLVAPHAGMSTDTWTAIIAAFLLVLALGNRAAGALAAPRRSSTSASAGRAALSIGTPRMLRQAALATAAGGIAVAAVPSIMPVWDAWILAANPAEVWRVVLFSALPCIPAGFLFGLATPLLMMSVIAINGARGPAIGAMYAAGAAGSVAGVLATLWVLLDTLGIRSSLLAIGVLSLANAVVILALSAAPRTPVRVAA
jgi:predicted membrane-bound spermidine synthase